ncbi:MAG: GNAT family N-acetyltransferase [Betaproteobacteria bacterium]|nr:GNAT family N-acetyltransferase [Betaproteobacteria bacterium]
MTLARATVQLASHDQAMQIALLARDHVEHGLGWSWTPDRVLESMRSADTNVAVVLDEGQRVQAFGIMRYGEQHAHLELLAVRPEQRRQGLASAVLRWLEAAARVAGAERITLECRRANAAARCLYLEHGYHERRIERGLYRQREDGIRLEKWLRPRADRADEG